MNNKYHNLLKKAEIELQLAKLQLAKQEVLKQLLYEEYTTLQVIENVCIKNGLDLESLYKEW